jgi:hypothetical protein
MLPPASRYQLRIRLQDLTPYCWVARYPHFREIRCHNVQSIQWNLKGWLLHTKLYGTTSSNTVVLITRTWFLIVRKEHRSMVLEHRMLERIFEPEREEAAGG